MINEITNDIHNGNIVIGIYFHFSAAFDTANHATFLVKLCHYELWGIALHWITIYLYNDS